MHGTAQGTPVPLSTFGGLATIADPNSLPEGASPRTYDTDFNVGSVGTRDGLTSVYTYAGSSVGPNAPGAVIPAPGWTNPSAILTNNATFASTTVNTGVQLHINEFGFNIPSTSTITGISVQVKGYSNVSSVVTIVLLKNGLPVGVPRAAVLPMTNGFVQVGAGISDTWGTSWTYADLNSANWGIAIQGTSTFHLGTVYFDFVQVEVGVAAGAANFNWISTFTDQDGTVKNLSQDANGDLWVENVSTNPGQLSLALAGITPNSFVNGVNGQGVEYMAFSDLKTGSDIPRQYTSGWIDKITQVGPGASPVFSSSSAAATTYPILSITQPVQQTWGFAFLLQSTGPGSNAPGNTVTVYYADSTIVPGPDQDLVGAFNAGLPVIVYLNFIPSTGGDTVGALATPYTAQITSLNVAKPNGQSRPFYYFTYQVPTSGFVWNAGQNGAGVTYQRTLATLTTSAPVPQLSVGDSVVITANSVPAWDSTWPISANFNSGSMAITQTALSTGGVGTYSYTTVQGANPVVGQLVTVTGTLNGNGALNVVNAPIATVTGTGTGTFTINRLPAGTSFPAEPESGQAITAGTLFGFDPGILTLGAGANPINGNGNGGSFTVTGSGPVIGSGTRQGTCFFITRNGYWTAPGPPVTFTTPDNTTTIQGSNIAIGPPNVIGRGIAFTEAGQDGVPGANFFVIPTNVNYIVQNQTFTATSTIIWDNTTTSATFSFTDDVLLNAEAIDVQGQNLFNLIEIGNPAWIVQYDSRNFYGGCQNKIQNFNNLSFDGGYLNTGNPVPLGWSAPDQFGSLEVSPFFGNSYYIKNTTGVVQNNYGQISQPAFQDAYQQPIINPNTTYSVRITARNPSGLKNGNLVVALTANGFPGSAVVLPLNSMTSTFKTFIEPLVVNPYSTVPAGLTLTTYGANFASGVDVEIDRIEIFPTEIPVLGTTVFGSYINEPEAVDAVTGLTKFISENQQPVNGGVVMYDTFYGLKDSSMYSLRSQPNLEPAQWDEPEVAQRAGACGINAYDFGEQWIVTACRNGLYLYEGGQPGRINIENYQIWNAINWKAKDSIWVKNDVPNSRLFIGIPLPTPNFWLPNAPVNANPTSPNVILMCNYRGVTSGEGIKSESAVHVTMFGTLEAGDMRRKWSLWNIASPYASFVTTSTDQAFYICNGNASSKVYMLDSANNTDDGHPINSLYTTYGFVDLAAAAKYPMLDMFRKRWGYMTTTVEGSGNLTIRLLPDAVLGPTDPITGYYPWTMPGGINLTGPGRDRESTLNFVATRTYLEYSGTNFDLSNITLRGKKDSWNVVTGQK